MVNNLLRVVALLLLGGWLYAVFTHGGKPRNPLSRRQVPSVASDIEEGPSLEESMPDPFASENYGPEDSLGEPFLPGDEPLLADDQPVPAPGEPMLPSAALLESIKDYVDTPRGGIDWQLFGQTKQKSYSYSDESGRSWMGVRPKFSRRLKQLNGKSVLLKGFMFPLAQQEKQKQFLLGPFPVSCPFHYDVTPNLVVEVHAEQPIAFSYDAVKVKGKLELVPKDDEYNVFYRLKKARRVR